MITPNVSASEHGDTQPLLAMLDHMQPFLSLAGLLDELRQPVVRDLAWTLTSPPLLADTLWPQRHPLSASPWAHQPGQLADWLRGLEQSPQPLLEWLDRSPLRRLGLYYERLWQFALRAAPGVELLAANLPIRLGGRTLGELDLLLRDAEGVHHLELAIKLYLGPQHGDGIDPARWLGPGSQDRLDLKLSHLNRHQLPMSNSRQGREVLADLRPDPVQAALWLGGYFFYPWPLGCAAPSGAQPGHCRGRWLYRRQLTEFFAQASPGCWQTLPRQAWLAPARLACAELWSPAQWLSWLAQLPEQASAQLLVRLEERAKDDWHEAERVFVMPDPWPDALAGV